MLPILLAQTSDDLQAAQDAANELATANAAAATGVGIFAVWGIFWVLFWLASAVLFIVALIDVIRRQFSNDSDKILWLVLIILLPVLGPILYFVIGKKKGSITGGGSAPAAS